MKSNDLSYSVIGCAMEVYKALGPGLLESIYHKAMIVTVFTYYDIPISLFLTMLKSYKF